ncbi:MAG: UDP-N-acetylmuramoyl-L-alanyl-D-glutamate--2,6-diaminopimelate ligase [Calditrichaeota bacterium]|nr:MAG: UDP-N-acetylmuramoyl-L-alanyl-D-glutamate--2,6-diaminopimelate ligase [Calditrichota bacterium]
MKRMSEILTEIPTLAVKGDLSMLIKDLHYDSRKITPGDAFVAIRGFQQDGHRFIEQAYEKGCRAFVVEDMVDLKDAVVVQVKDTRRWLPYLALNFFDRVAEHLNIIGITGTNGKTTTAYILHSILQKAGWKTGLITTVETRFGEEQFPSERTTPEAVDLHRLFSRMFRVGCKSVVMEVSSHALALHRVDGIPFRAAVFTNLGRDHLDFHHSMEEYFRAKLTLFQFLGQNDRAIVNLDDEYSERIIRVTDGDVLTYSMNQPTATVSLRKYQPLSEGMALEFNVPSGTLFCSTSLVGKFNIYNIMAAVTTALSLGISEEKITEGIEALERIPGRSEPYLSSRGFKIYIDYAHTPEGLQRMLEALLEFQPQRLIVVFGCGGDRDRDKRPMMGKIAEDYADIIILTNDNPRSEDPMAIIEDIKQGIYDQSRVTVIPDRREAILSALSMAQKNEIVLIAGKGHETYQEFKGRKIFFDDHQVVEGYLQQNG